MKQQTFTASSHSQNGGVGDLNTGEDLDQVKTALDFWTGECLFFKNQQLIFLKISIVPL